MNMKTKLAADNFAEDNVVCGASAYEALQAWIEECAEQTEQTELDEYEVDYRLHYYRKVS